MRGLRTFNSVGSWSPDGHYFAIAVKHGGKDDLVIFDVKTADRVDRRFKVGPGRTYQPVMVPGRQADRFSPATKNGLSDLFIINADGTNLPAAVTRQVRRSPSELSPDGKTIAPGDGSRFPDRHREPEIQRAEDRALPHRPPTSSKSCRDGRVQRQPTVGTRWESRSRSCRIATAPRTCTSTTWPIGRPYQLTKVYTGIAHLQSARPGDFVGPRR